MGLFCNQHRMFPSLLPAIVPLALCVMPSAVRADDRNTEYRQPQQAESLDDSGSSGRMTPPTGARVIRDVPYGADSLQRMDLYLPQQTTRAPVILMVHGGAWRLGDKGASAVVENKAARWVPKGFIFISTNYRMLPKTAPLEQAQDIASAVAMAQARATSWGGDPAKFILMGHSAGAHLVALLSANPDMAFKQGAKPWLGTVALDSAAYDVVKIMEAWHARLYDRAFKSDSSYWKATSPFHVLAPSAVPLLAVCSTRRNESCPQANRYVAKALALKIRASLLEQDLTHAEINLRLGASGSYTEAVESFMGSLDPAVMRALKK